ncbi:hypothetical protein [Thiomonas sp. FB-Cd]|uniref:hypothetical protein n=1 Tax=Thiomonas sp. FB-Cd TaxID=1158292 RepID=UPI0012DE1635|nr:hypothetical protein [Thiomonas sp. FB-Cd]
MHRFDQSDELNCQRELEVPFKRGFDATGCAAQYMTVRWRKPSCSRSRDRGSADD